MSRPTKETLMAKLTEQGKTFDPEINYNFLWDLLDEGTVFPVVVKREDGTRLEVAKELYDRARETGLTHKEVAVYADEAALLLHLDETFPLKPGMVMFKRPDETHMELTQELYDRAVAAGLGDEEIAVQPDADALLTYLNESFPLEDEVEVKDGEKTLYTVTKAIFERATKKIGLAIDQLKGYANREALVDALNKMSPTTNPEAKAKTSKVPAYSPHKPMEDKFEIESKLEATFITKNRAQFDEGTLQEELRRINRVHGPGQPVKIVKTSTFKPVNGINKKRQAVKFLITTYVIYMK